MSEKLRIFLIREDELERRENLLREAGILEETDWAGWIRNGDSTFAEKLPNA